MLVDMLAIRKIALTSALLLIGAPTALAMSPAHAAPLDGVRTPVSPSYTVTLTSNSTGGTWTGHESVSFTNASTDPLTEVYLRLWDNFHGSCPSTPVTVSNVTGGSAGGYTTLCALVFTDAFAAGASYYGVADLEALARDTHKFESRYLDRLVGPWPQDAERYRERSPIHHVDRLSCPVILLQGLEDPVVPPAQAEAMAAALERKGIPYEYLAFEGEQHGFRKAETIKRAAEAELAFYGRVFGFEPT